MKIAFELDPIEANLLRCLLPRGNAKRDDGSPEAMAKNLLVTAMKKEARLRKIPASQLDTAALVQATNRRGERENNRG